MRGPNPKPAALRQRRNRESTAAALPAEPVGIEAPALPARGRRKWHALTLAWWADVWASPMAAEFLRADVHMLFMLADMVDTYWRKPSVGLASEIRQQRQCFGLTPIDRRRLQWTVQKVEDGSRRAPVATAPPGPVEDPRSVLRVV